MVQEGQGRKQYPSDRTDEPGAIVAPLLPAAQRRPRGGRPRKVQMRAGLHTRWDRNRRGCPWDMWPHALLPQRTVYDDVGPWGDEGTWAKRGKGGRARTRAAAGRAPPPRGMGIDSQWAKPTEMGGPERG